MLPAVTMAEHPNAERIRSLFAAFEHGDLEAINDVLPETATWHFPGNRGRLAGTHRGRNAIFAFLTKVMELTGGNFRLELIDVLANDDNAVAIFRGHGRRNDRDFDNHTCLRMRLDHGRVVELWEFVWDLYDVDDFWS